MSRRCPAGGIGPARAPVSTSARRQPAARPGNGDNRQRPVRVSFYTRISTDEDHQKYSLGAQAERLEAFCKAQWGDGWRLHKVYRDTESGTHMNRPGLEEMLFDAEAQAFDTLLVFRVDRLSRKVRELALMVDELTKHGVVLKSITEPFDTANPAGKMMLQMLGVFAEFEHATIIERTKVGMEKKAKTGAWVAGGAPYGYQLDPERGLVINEDEALLVRKMFQMYTFGQEGAHTICHKLNEAGHRKRSGKRWDKRVILHMIKNPLYIGKIRWREVLYEGNHPGLVSENIFDQAQEIMKRRVEDLKGRQFHNGDERLLAGIIKCARCKGHMVGVSARKKAKKYPYYICAKRSNTRGCDQDYVRADLLEAAIVEDVKGILRDEQFMARIWEEANRCLCAERPALEQEIAKVEAKIAKARATIDRYFAAFEAETMKPEVCSQKVDDLNARIAALESEKRDLEERRKRLEIPPVDREMLTGLLDEFGNVMAQGTHPQQKDLLRRLVKKVLIHDRRTIEIWYALPNQASVRTPAHSAARMCQSTNHSLAALPEVWFRILHVAVTDGDVLPVEEFREQTVEIALGPNGAFKHSRIGALRRRVASRRVVTAGPTRRPNPTPPRLPRTPQVAELLRKAITWQELLSSGAAPSQAAISRREGITRARVGQVMDMLRLAPDIQERLLAMPATVGHPPVTERTLRPILHIKDLRRQTREFERLLEFREVAASRPCHRLS